MIWKVAVALLTVVLLVMAVILYNLWWQPRPLDTTDVRVFDGDTYAVDYCAKVELDGSGLTSAGGRRLAWTLASGRWIDYGPARTVSRLQRLCRLPLDTF